MAPTQSLPDHSPPARTLRRPAELVEQGLVSAERLPALEAVARSFAVAVTPAMAAAIDPADPADPIAAQFVPSEAELTVLPEERADPIGDEPFSPVKGIVHRYHDRVLLKPVHVCPIYCRFCFRREMVGPGGEGLDAAELDAALAYIASRPQIWEVVMTGGDPMILAPRRMAELVERLNAIAHLGLVRIHTRVPIVDPDRITAELVAALKGSRIPTWVMLHSNHWQELTQAARAAIGRLVDAGIPMLAQTVLLKGINDDVETLTRTFRALVGARVKPHYLHHGDLAKGTSHFRTSLAEGQALMRALRGDVSGLCQPTYVLDIPGGHGKVPVGPGYLTDHGDGQWTVEDPRGNRHAYRG
ncbi:lysine-2,3-aminomutase-like protein [Oleisolibacter albus]|uniref:lysine-2,3-aminomutase-like protein n=1 Tax=Oleisolibacter albus TaxID=2171757 RepID=UPI000DF2C313|nr:lysine-2,3-aminomutase-like protein [Oleisolibacter albus]